jgi:hypothetical protein
VAVYRDNLQFDMDFYMENTVANGDSEFGFLTRILNSKENVLKKMRRCSKNGDELRGDNLKVNYIHLLMTIRWVLCSHSVAVGRDSARALSPSCIALSFNGFGSISWDSVWFLCFHICFFGFPTFST